MYIFFSVRFFLLLCCNVILWPCKIYTSSMSAFTQNERNALYIMIINAKKLFLCRLLSRHISSRLLTADIFDNFQKGQRSACQVDFRQGNKDTHQFLCLIFSYNNNFSGHTIMIGNIQFRLILLYYSTITSKIRYIITFHWYFGFILNLLKIKVQANSTLAIEAVFKAAWFPHWKRYSK